MANKARVEIKGHKELRRELRRAKDKTLDEQLKAVHKESAELVVDTARPLTPVRTGKLRDSLRASATKTGGRARAGKKAVPYAGPVHFGWPARRIRPQTFLYDAADKRSDEVLAKFAKAIEDISAEIARRGSAGG